jgi:hypothetical protein
VKKILIWLLLFVFACPPPTPTPVDPPPVEEDDPISLSPTAAAPDDWSGGDILVSPSAISAPETIAEHFTAIGEVFDVIEEGKPDGTDFGAAYATLDFPFDPDRLAEEGLMQEFMVFYEDGGQWLPVDKLEVLEGENIVRAYTSHLTPFVLTALPESSTAGSTVPEPPAAIYDDFPAGIGGSGNAVFTVVGESYTYYRDREYYIRPLDTSAVNTNTFDALGLHGALGIATVNGGRSLGSFADHKRYTGDDYIVMDAHLDLDVYVLYDTRGGSGPDDYSQDAPWLTSTGFSPMISTDDFPTPTTYFLETTDAVGRYAIYHKAYSQGETIRLHGNRQGVTDPGINTNYWVIFKRQGVYDSEPASNLLVANPDTTPPAKVSDLAALINGSNIDLSWTNPADPDFDGVVIRLSNVDPVEIVTDGLEPVGSSPSPTEFTMTGAVAGESYVFTVFALDENLNYQIGGTQVRVTIPTPDPDLSGHLSDGADPVAGALIRLFDGAAFDEYTVSDISGYYEFAVVPSGTYTMVIARDGFAPETRIVTIP